MDALQLKLFLSLSNTLSFTKTANELFISQPSVSNSIKSLEEELGVKLLNRDNKNVSLSAEGRAFVGYAIEILSTFSEAENRLTNIAGGLRGHIKIAMLSSSVELFSECHEEFNKNHPDVQVDVDIKEGVELIKALTLNSHDIYFANENMMPDNGSIEYIQTGFEHLHLFMHKSIAQDLKLDMNDWSQLEGHSFVSVTQTEFAFYEQIMNICENRGITPDIINYCNQADSLLLAVNSGIGMAILPPQLKYYLNMPNVVSIPIDGDDAVFSTVVAWNKDKINSETQSFLQVSALSNKPE